MSKDSNFSSQREKVLEYKFLSELTEYLWTKEIHDIEFLFPDVDNAGSDLVIVTKTGTHFFQIKGTNKKGNSNPFNVHINFLNKLNSYVIWIKYEESKSKISVSYKICNIKNVDVANLKLARHNKQNKNGERTERPNIRKLEKTSFKKINIPGLVELLSNEDSQTQSI